MAGGVFSGAKLNGMTIRESANDGSDFTNPDADYRRLFLGEDGLLHLRDSAGVVTELSAGSLRSGTAALATTEATVGWQSTRKVVTLYDGQRERVVGMGGWLPTAFPVGHTDSAFATALNLPANGGSIAIPMMVTGHMSSRGIAVANTDTGTLRTCEIRLYQQYLNNGNAGENTLAEVAGTDGTLSFTPGGAASTQGITFSALPVYLGPGIYWLVLRNTSATQTWGLASTAASSAAGVFVPNLAQTKTLGSALGTTLDFVAATWVKVTAHYAIRIVGNVFGTTSSF